MTNNAQSKKTTGLLGAICRHSTLPNFNHYNAIPDRPNHWALEKARYSVGPSINNANTIMTIGHVVHFIVCLESLISSRHNKNHRFQLPSSQFLIKEKCRSLFTTARQPTRNRIVLWTHCVLPPRWGNSSHKQWKDHHVSPCTFLFKIMRQQTNLS